MTEYFKRDPAGVPKEVNDYVFKKLFGDKSNALGHTEGNQLGAADSGDPVGGSGDTGGEVPVMTAETMQDGFIAEFNRLAEQVHDNAVAKGWWEAERNNGEIIALMHSELSEALEAIRNGNPPDDKIPEFSGVEAELADVIIRIMDMAPARGWRIAEAVVAKIAMNKTRPYKHGRKAF